MTIGKSSRKSSVRSSIRAPKFLDKSSGFYGRLDEPEVAGEGDDEVRGQEVELKGNGTEGSVREDISQAAQGEDAFHFNDGLMEDDGETLLQRNTSRRSSRWRRSSRRKQREGRVEEDAARDERPSALDRAFRRGWEAFITNLYSITLTPVTSSSKPSSSPASKKKESVL
uniref:Sb:cb1058 n=1 Tax=Labrus bergylta TaxID=56723 RepID=A0A3Q3FMF9_9LABR